MPKSQAASKSSRTAGRKAGRAVVSRKPAKRKPAATRRKPDTSPAPPEPEAVDPNNPPVVREVPPGADPSTVTQS